MTSKEFILRGNVVDPSVGVIMGAAFTGIVDSFVTDILMLPIGKLSADIDFSINFSDGHYPTLKAAKEAGAVTIMRTGTPWRDLPPDYGDWSNTHRRLIRWRDKGIWGKLLEILIDEPDYEWPMIDASHCKVHQHVAGARGGNQDMIRTKGGSTQSCISPWMRIGASRR